jgi:hypothetical protein
MSPAETSASPSYPARVVRHLSERRHALDAEAYADEVERVLARVLKDPTRGCATKILAMNALRDADLCDETVTKRYKSLVVAGARGAAENSRDGGGDARAESTKGASSDAHASSGTAAQTGTRETAFEDAERRWRHGVDPRAFSHDEDTAILKELEYLTEKSRRMRSRARVAARRESTAERWRPDGSSTPCRAAAGCSGGRSGGNEATESVCKADAASVDDRFETKTKTVRNLRSISSASRDAAAAARDMTAFAAELEKKYPGR